MLVPGSKLPAFKATACVSLTPGEEFKTISSDDFPGRWLVLYSYPRDFTFVCPTEIVEFDSKLAEFEKRKAVVLGGSMDNEYSHLAWRKMHPDLENLKHPLLHWPASVAEELGIVHPVDQVALRATLLVDPEGTVRFAAASDLSVGRNVGEVLRQLDALQTGQLVACEWRPGTPTLTERMQKMKKAG